MQLGDQLHHQGQSIEGIRSTQENILISLHNIEERLQNPLDGKYVYGIDGIADLFHCSRPTAQRIKSSGVIDKAITQHGRKIIVEAEYALQLLRTHRS